MWSSSTARPTSPPVSCPGASARRSGASTPLPPPSASPTTPTATPWPLRSQRRPAVPWWSSCATPSGGPPRPPCSRRCSLPAPTRWSSTWAGRPRPAPRRRGALPASPPTVRRGPAARPSPLCSPARSPPTPGGPPVADIAIRGVTKSYDGRVAAVDDVDIDVADGELLVLVGPSGCGKSTLLRMIAGLEEVTAGTISIGGRDVTHLQPKDRDIAMVFQSYALYPHMTVRKNIGYPLKLAKAPKDEIDRRGREGGPILHLTPETAEPPGRRP